MASGNDALRSSIGKVKSGRCHYAFITSNKGSVLLISSSPPTTTAINDAKKECQGSLAASGPCFFEAGEYVFQTAGAPGSVAGAIKKCLAQHAGITANVVVRSASEEAEAHDAEAEQETIPGAAGTPGAHGASSAPQANPRLAKIEAHLKLLQARLALPIVASSPSAAGIKLRLSEASMFARKSNFDQAEKVLAAADSLLQHLVTKA